jgi:hypothetical protein
LPKLNIYIFNFENLDFQFFISAIGECPAAVQVTGFGETADGKYNLSDQLHDGLPYYKKQGKNIS